MPDHFMLLRDFFYPRRGLLALSLALDLLANLVTVALPVLVSQAIAVLLGFNSLRGQWLFDANTPIGFQFILVLAVSTLLLKAGLDFMRKRLHSQIGEDWISWLRNRIFRHQLRINLSQYEDRGIGRHLLRFSGDLSSVQHLITRGALQFIADLSLLIIGIAVIFWLDQMLGLLTGSALLLISAGVALMNHWAGKTEIQRRNKKSEILAFVNLRLLNMASVKALNREAGEIQQFERKSEQIRRSGVQFGNWKALADTFIAFGIYATLLLVLWVTYLQQQSDPDFSPENTFAITLLLLSLRTIFGRIFQIGLVWKKGNISLRKIASLLALPIEPGQNLPEKKEPQKGSLIFTEVTHHLLDRKVLDKLTFTLAPGSIGVLHGDSGSGKTVVTKLICGLYQLQSGEITLGENQIMDLHIKDLRRSIAVVSAATPLYGSTVLDAIANSRKPENRDKAKAALIHWQQLFPALEGIRPDMRLLETLPQLTLGQQRLLQHLRAQLAQKPFWIFDEPFLGLEAASIEPLMRQIQASKARKGILILSAQPRTFMEQMLHPEWVKSLA